MLKGLRYSVEVYQAQEAEINRLTSLGWAYGVAVERVEDPVWVRQTHNDIVRTYETPDVLDMRRRYGGR